MKQDSQLAKKLYNKQFDKYSKEQAKNKRAQDLRRKVHSLLGNIKSRKILFAGCGDGLECVPAVEKKAKVTGIDISERGIELAKNNCPGAEFCVMDFEKTKFKNNSFDIIVSILAVVYKRNLGLTLKEFRRILKNKGFILLVVPHPLRKMIKYNKMNYFVKGKKWEVWRGTKRFNYYRLFEDYFYSFVNSKLKVIKLIEPKPIRDKKSDSALKLNHPHFLLFKLVKD
jgi:ubiquinone/menaquinone biosynthesis C-methylase UbiE